MRLLGHTLLAGTAAALSFALTPACVDNDQSIYIRQVQIGAVQGTSGICTYSPDPAAVGWLEGVVDTALTDNYSAVLLVGSQLITRGDTTNVRSESNKAHLNGAIVRVSDANGNDISEFTAQSEGFVDAANNTNASFGLMKITLLDAPTLQKIGNGLPAGQTKLVLANIKAFGETLGGVDLESGEFQYPIRICNGCLISFLNADDPLTQGTDCNLSSSTAGGGTGGGSVSTTQQPCNLGQDEIVPCTLCKDTNPRCRTLSTP